MRILLVTLLITSLALAAPIKQTREQVKAQVAALWKKTNDPTDVVAATRAFFALLDHPGTVDFLEKELVPVKCTKAEIEKWLKDLNDGDDEAQKKAIAKLNYFHPSLYLPLQEVVDILSSSQGASWLCSVCYGVDDRKAFGEQQGVYSIALKIEKQGPVAIVTMKTSNVRGKESESRYATFKSATELYLPSWEPLVRGLALLRLSGGEQAKHTIRLLAEGHSEIRPAKMAKEYLNNFKTVPFTTKLTNEALWSHLLDMSTREFRDYLKTIPGELIYVAPLVEMSRRKDVVEFLKKNLKPIHADRDRSLELLKLLVDEDDKIARTAYDELLQSSPRLVLSTDEILNAGSGKKFTCRVYSVITGDNTGFKVYKWDTAEILNHTDYFSLVCSLKNGGRNSSKTILPDIPQMTTVTWTRQQLGIILLERLGTPEAKAFSKT